MRQPTTETITWMPYPENKPPLTNSFMGGRLKEEYRTTLPYLVTCYDRVEEILWDGYKWLDIDNDEVVAFAKMPKGYGGEE